MKKLMLIIIGFILFFNFGYANQVSQKFLDANNFYQKGDYLTAIKYYEEIIENGYQSPEVYYNLGNAYFKMNKFARSILNFERAKRIAPDDEDIDFNLNIANLQIIDKIEPLPKLFFIEWLDAIRALFSSESWATIVVIFLWLGFAALAGFIVIWSVALRKLSFAVMALSFIIAIASFIFAIQEHNRERATDSAIIFSPSVYVKSSPDAAGTDLFILHEGAKLQILDEVGNWKKIRLANGNVGWIPEKTFEVI